MIEWLVPVSVFWILTALYLGGARIRIEGGGGLRQLTGLLLHFVLFLAVFAAARAGFRAVAHPILAVVFGTIVAIIVLRPLARFAFRLVGVKITKDPSGSPVATH